MAAAAGSSAAPGPPRPAEEAPVVTGPGDAMAARAAGRGRMRAAHADREHAVDALQAAYVVGRLTKDEFDARVGQALAARTYADLAAVTADIPAAPPAVPAPRRPRPAGPPSVRKVAIRCACTVLAVELLLVLLILAVPIYGTVDLAILVNLGGLPLAWDRVLVAWRADRARRLPPRPAPGAPAVDDDRGGAAGPDLARCQARRDVPARAGLRLA
jgi:hypothetical protein